MKSQVLGIVLATIALVAACARPGPTSTPVPSVAAGTAAPTRAVVQTTAAATAMPDATATGAPAPTEAASATTTADATGAAPTPLAFSPKVEVVASGLEVPWALAFAPDGRLFVTERPGRIRVIVGGRLLPEPVLTLNVARTTSEGGLLGLALDPAFAQNGYLYIDYTYTDGTTVHNRISRLTLKGNVAGEEHVLLDGLPAAVVHNGGRLKFGPDGKLYATLGDTTQRDLAQSLDAPVGKILRLNADGSIPSDNPFPGSPIYSYGHRNPEGLAWTCDGKLLYETEHGPSGELGLCCRDEVNLVTPGKNYGWPLVTLPAGDPRFVDPILDSGASETWAPAGAAFYCGDLLAPWRGDLFFGTLRGEHLHRVVLDPADPRRVIQDEKLFEGIYGRIRDVTMGPDGALYFTTSNRDGRGNPAPEDDRVLRIVPGP